MFFVIDSLFQYILLHKCIVTDKDNNLLLLNYMIIIYCLHTSPITYTVDYLPIWLSVLEEGEECIDMIII